MYVDEPDNKAIDYIIENLCDKAIDELLIKFGKSYEYDTKIYLYSIPFKNIKIIRLKNNDEPVALFGYIPLENNSAGIFFLSTNNLYEGNMIKFLKGTKHYIDEWSKEYPILLDDCYKKNDSVIKWLKFLKFEPTTTESDNFQIYKREVKNA